MNFIFYKRNFITLESAKICAKVANFIIISPLILKANFAHARCTTYSTTGYNYCTCTRILQHVQCRKLQIQTYHIKKTNKH